MKEKVIQDFDDYIKQKEIYNIRLTIYNGLVKIDSSTLNFFTARDVFFLCILTYISITIEDPYFYFIPLAAGYIVAICLLWADFNSLNSIGIDLIRKEVYIKSKNPIKQFFLKYILRKPTVFNFKDLQSINIVSNESSDISMLRYYIHVKFDKRPKITVVNFKEEEHANAFIIFFEDVLKN